MATSARSVEDPLLTADDSSLRKGVRSQAEDVEQDTAFGVTNRADTTMQLVLLWLYSFLKWFKPSEAFLVEYMVSKGFTNSEVYTHIFPIWVYCHLPALLLVHPPIIFPARLVVVVGSLLGAATTALTLGAPQGGLGMLQASQVTVAWSWSAHSAFSALAFACVPRSRYPLMAHGNRAATLAGSCISALVGQLLRPIVGLDCLFTISLVGQILTFVTALLLRSAPSDADAQSEVPGGMVSQTVKWSRWCLKGGTAIPSKEGAQTDFVLVLRGSLKFVVSVGLDVWSAMGVPGILSWTCWSLSAEAVHRMVFTYWQNLAISVEGSSSAADTNGFFSSLMYLLATLATLLAVLLPLGRMRIVVLAASPAICGALLLAAAQGPLLNTYAALLLYQCLHEITGAACATSVGSAVTAAYATTNSRAIHGSGGRSAGEVTAPPERRLAALFTLTSATSVLVETGIQASILGFKLQLGDRFEYLGGLLLLFTGSLGLARAVHSIQQRVGLGTLLE